jgi:hypothetical protein
VHCLNGCADPCRIGSSQTDTDWEVFNARDSLSSDWDPDTDTLFLAILYSGYAASRTAQAIRLMVEEHVGIVESYKITSNVIASLPGRADFTQVQIIDSALIGFTLKANAQQTKDLLLSHLSTSFGRFGIG